MIQAEIIAIGDEVISGQIADTNSAWLARRLRGLGIRVGRMVAVGDRIEAIAEALREASRRAPLAIATGGLGPTFDDLTRDGAAAFAGVPLVRDPAALAHLEAWFKDRGRPMPPQNLRQAEFPSGAEVLPNRQGTAPGFAIEAGGPEGSREQGYRGPLDRRSRALGPAASPGNPRGSAGTGEGTGGRPACLFFLPGVPQEMEAMFQGEVAPRIVRRFGLRSPLDPFRIHLFGIWESEAGRRLEGAFILEERRHLGIRASGGAITVAVYGDPEMEPEAVVRAAEGFPGRLRTLFRDVAFGEGDATLAGALVDAFRAARAKLAIAESCTGGLASSLVTGIPGASEVFERGFVVYSDLAKTELLGVPPDLLRSAGAVSEAAARALSEGALENARADVAVAITGIAGPTGGSEEKPVGLVWFSASRRGEGGKLETHSFFRTFKGPRTRVQLFSAATALDLARRYLEPLTKNILK